MAQTGKGLASVDLGRLESVPWDKALAGGEGTFLLVDMEGLDEGSAEMGEGSDGFGFDFTLGDGGEEAS
jgi:hypothetical protein